MPRQPTPKVPKFYWDPRATTELEISAYIHCQRCGDELPYGVSPKEWSRTQTGITADGSIQIWCNRHEINVALGSFRPRPGLVYP